MTRYTSQDGRPALSIVIPVFNERDNILPLAREIRTAVDGLAAYEIVYVDDGSTDGTGAQLARAIMELGPRLRMVGHHLRRGQSAALVTGVRTARGEWVATLDGDGQNVPADIPRLFALALDARERDAAVVCVAGHRRRRRDTWLKRISSRVANAARAWFLGDGIPDTGCGLKVFRRDVFMSLPTFDHMHRFLPALFQFAGGRVIVAEVSHRARKLGVSKYGLADRLWVGIVDLVGVRWLRARYIVPPMGTGRPS